MITDLPGNLNPVSARYVSQYSASGFRSIVVLERPRCRSEHVIGIPSTLFDDLTK